MHRLKFSLAVLIICYQQLFAQNTDRLFFKEYYSDNQAQGMTTIDGINFIWTADISADGKHVYTCGGVANVASGGEDDNAIAVFVRNQTTGELTFVQVLFDNQDSGIADGLFSCRDVKVSPDGKHVYSAGSGDHTLGIFSRNSMSGQLTYLSSIKDGVGGVDGLAGLQSLALNTSGTRLLAVGRTDDAIVLFTRDPVTGSLTFEDMKKNGLAGVTGLDRPISVSVSPDGKHVYTASGSNVNFSGNDALTVFSINESTDNLNFVASYFEGQSQGMQTIDGLDQVTAVKVSPDGKHLYAACEVDEIAGSNGNGNDWISIFSRNETTGELTWIARIAGFKICNSPFGADSESFIDISSDGNLVLITKSWADNGVALFTRDTTTGLLTFANGQCEFDPDPIGLNLPRGMVLDPTFNHLYVAGNASDAISMMKICHAPAHLMPPGNPLPTGIYVANSEISSNNLLSPGSTVFRAPDFVTLQPNFTVPGSAVFDVIMAGCDN